MKLRSVIASAITAAALICAPTAAFAADPVDLAGRYIADEAGVLGSGATGAETAVHRLADETDVNLLVVLVDTFENPADRSQWAVQTAVLNQLGDNDLLLAIAVEDRLYQVDAAVAFPLTDAQLDNAANNGLLPSLGQSDWSAAVAGYADSLAAEAASAHAGSPVGDGSNGANLAPFPLKAVGVVMLSLGAISGVVIVVLTRWKRRKRAAEIAAELARLDREASAKLIATDEVIRTSEEEVMFAAASFGDDEVASFQGAVDNAKTHIRKAFEARQQLDDEIQRADVEKRALLVSIVTICDTIEKELTDHSDRFDTLRELAANAASAISDLEAQVPELSASIPIAANTLSKLETAYSPSALSSVASNVNDAVAIVGTLGTIIGTAKSHLAAEESGRAALVVRTVQKEIARVRALVDGVDAARSSLSAGSANLRAAVADTRGDIATARAAEANTDPGVDVSEIAGAVRAAEEALVQVDYTDPLSSLATVSDANRYLDQVLDGVRDREKQLIRARAERLRTIDAAQSEIASAQNYIATHRSRVGVAARTRVSDAQRHLELAIATDPQQPVTAVHEATQAQTTAAAALRLAISDVHRSEVATHSSYSAGFGSPIATRRSAGSSGGTSISRSTRSSSSTRGRSSGGSSSGRGRGGGGRF